MWEIVSNFVAFLENLNFNNNNNNNNQNVNENEVMGMNSKRSFW